MKPFDRLLRKPTRKAVGLIRGCRAVSAFLILLIGYFLRSDYEYKEIIIAAALLVGLPLGIFAAVYASKRFKCPDCGFRIPLKMVAGSPDSSFELNHCPGCGAQIDLDKVCSEEEDQ